MRSRFQARRRLTSRTSRRRRYQRARTARPRPSRARWRCVRPCPRRPPAAPAARRSRSRAGRSCRAATTTGLRRPSRIAPPTPSGSSSVRRPPSLPRISRPPTLDTAARADPRADRAGERLHGRLEHLERHVAGEAVGHDHVDGRARQVEALHVAGEVERALGEPVVGGEHLGGALARLLADRQQADARPLDAHAGLHEAGAHVGELHEVLGARLHARAGVQQQHGPVGDRQQHGERGPEDAPDALDRDGAGGERGPGRAGRDERLGAPVGDGGGRLHDRGLLARAHGGHRLVAGLDALGRVDDLRALARPGELRLRAEQQDG